jgi:phosphohistidine swiveling domain-containing protein
MAPHAELVRPLGSLRAGDGALAGGKGANLGELIAAGFPVPDGFALTTDAYRLAAQAAAVDPADPVASSERLRTTEPPAAVARVALDAYHALGGGPVAVRSSATAEDLAGASFAGQQDTFLGIVGDEALLDAVRGCWASLWNERAVAYRRANGVDDAGLALAVVVQCMVDAVASGVMFTADPISGRRGRVVIEAAPGLGEAIVSGSVDPDRAIVEAATGAIIERRIAGDRPALDDARIQELAALGVRAEQHFGSPQDLEFALDRSDRVWLVQSRPITTLFPLPPLPDDGAGDPRIYLSVNVIQGYFEPITPMGIQAFRLLGASVAAAFGRPMDDPVAGPPVLVEAASRAFVDATGAFRNPVGRVALQRLMEVGEARIADVLRMLDADPRFAVGSGSRPRTVRLVAGAVARSGIPRSVLRLLRRPDVMRERYLRDFERLAAVFAPASASAMERIDAFERLFRTLPPRLLPRLVGMVAAGQVSYLAARRLIGSRATEDELRAVLRAAPHNPTTEMDLALWRLAVDSGNDPTTRQMIAERPAAELAAAYRTGGLPAPFQHALSSFLDRYGFRGIGEIDIGVPRWADDPTHIIGAVANYLRLDDAALAPDAQFARGAREAEAMVQTLLSRVHGPRRWILRALLLRTRSLVGMREVPKFQLVRLVLGRGREQLQAVGEELVGTGRLAAPDDVFFLTLPELRRAVAGDDLGPTVAERRVTYERERARRHIPRVLLSDGTDVEATLPPVEGGAGLRGSPASPGRVTGPARVIRSPHGARLEPGEILVAPSTDPGWTPLFLTAGGLVMEMGGVMSHGAVVAREYGIPAVVGVAGATDRIATGDRVTVDGSAGVVSLVEPDR